MALRPLKTTFLITAGPTVEDLDPVRFISNRATGRLGFAVARAALAAGHRTLLVHGPVAEALIADLDRVRSSRLTRLPVRSASQMCRAVLRLLPRAGVVVMSAAVADFTPARVSRSKLKKRKAGLTLQLKPTLDILAQLGRIKRARRTDLVLIGFALETGVGRKESQRQRTRLAEAHRKLAAKNLDAIVLDTPAAMGAERAAFQVLSAGQLKARSIHARKDAFARYLVKLGEALKERRHG